MTDVADAADTHRPEPDCVIDLKDVSVFRSGTTLLGDVTWQVELDERWIVLGPNGAGKSTLMALASAHMHPSAGLVHILGERVGRVDLFDLRPRIGIATASIAARIPPTESVLNLVMSAGYSVLGRWREAYDAVDSDRARYLLEQWGIARLADRPFGTLSSGERKRTQICRALMTDPELLLLDEPASGLDLGGREDLLARLSAFAADPDSPAMVMVTHHVEEIPRDFSHVLLLRDGEVVTQGLLEDELSVESIRATFDVDVHLSRRRGRYFASVG